MSGAKGREKGEGERERGSEGEGESPVKLVLFNLISFRKPPVDKDSIPNTTLSRTRRTSRKLHQP